MIHRLPSITLAIQSADEGGLFEYAPNIRQDGENFEAVKAVLGGVSDQVKSLALEPGDLQLFKGRYSLHPCQPAKRVDAALCGDPVLCRTARYGRNA